MSSRNKDRESTGDSSAVDKKRRLLNVSDSSAAAQKADALSTKPPIDAYTNTIQYEETESQSRTPAFVSEHFHQSCADFRALLDDMLAVKQDSDPDAGELAELRAFGAQQLVAMKKLNRLDKLHLRAGRDALSKQKLVVESNHLQLQNLLYEAEHLRKKIQRCLAFKSQDEQIDLVPVEQFYAETQTEPVDDEHALRVSRLEWELSQRQMLADMCSELQKEKERAAERIAERTVRLDGLGPGLEALLRATRPVQEALDMRIEDEWKVAALANRLPRPLYMAYVNLNAYAEVCDPLLSVKIAGNELDIAGLEDIDDEDDDDVQSIAGASSQRYDERDDDSDADDRQRSGVRGGVAAATAPSPVVSTETAAKREAQQLERLLRPHPLSVTLELSTGDPKSPAVLLLTVRYLPVLRLAAVQPECSGISDEHECMRGVLAALRHDDDRDFGSDCPSASTYMQLTAIGIDAKRFGALLAGKRLGVAYRWAQQLCGLQTTNATSADGGSPAKSRDASAIASVPQLVQQIRQRWSGRLSLVEQLRALGAKCTPVTWAQFAQRPGAQRFIGPPVGEDGAGAGTAPAAATESIVNEHDLFYALNVPQSAQKPYFECTVRISIRHPAVLPLWTLALHGDLAANGGGATAADGPVTALDSVAVREIEAWVNSAVDGSGEAILGEQLKRLQNSLVIYKETLTLESGDATKASTRDKTFVRAFRNRTRARPLREVQTGMGSVIYTQV